MLIKCIRVYFILFVVEKSNVVVWTCISDWQFVIINCNTDETSILLHFILK